VVVYPSDDRGAAGSTTSLQFFFDVKSRFCCATPWHQLPSGAESLGVHQIRGLPEPEEVFTYPS
jgi:hypothetical protein